MPVFAMVFEEQPKSLAAEKKQGYINRLREIAKAEMAGQNLLTGDLYVHIIWFHSVRSTGDIDNIAKNILDAMKHIVYEDDEAVVRCQIERVDIRDEDHTFSYRTASPPAFETLEQRLSSKPKHVVYVEVGPVGPITIRSGPGG